jgi:hypothetical protein
VACELAAAVGLFLNNLVTLAAMIGAVLLVLYATAIAANLIRGRSELPCGCTGRQSQPISWSLVLRNGGLICLLIATGKSIVVPSVLVVEYLVIIALRLLTKNRSQWTANEVS